jgi:hypothetical protein
MFESITEATDLTCEQIDTEHGIIRGVKLLGLISKNGRRYPENTLKAALPLYEGAKVNLNHARLPNDPREYQDRIGLVRNPQLKDGKGIFGDLYYNPKHPCAPMLEWDAQSAPQNVGLSHNILGRIKKENNEIVVEEIQNVISVDLVADPATTKGLFEHTDATPDQKPMDPDPQPTRETLEADYAAIFEEVRQESRDALLNPARDNLLALIAAKLPYTAIDRHLIEFVLTSSPEICAEAIKARKQLVEALQKNQSSASITPISKPKSENPITKNAQEFAAALHW